VRDLMFNRLTLIWLLLVGATLVSVEFFSGIFSAGDPRAAAVVVMIVAFVKVRFVGRDFMELRSAPTLAQRIFDGWVAIVCSAMIAIYLLRISV
jgi:Prokaryotic Cytochrome C oxidase subunit IV